MSVGSRIKEARIHKKLTQEKLAQQIGVTKGAVANYENGVSFPKVDILYRLFDALDCDANYLYMDEMSEVATFQTSPAEQEHIKKYRTLDRYGKEMVDSALRFAYHHCTAPAEEPENNVIYFSYREYVQPVSAGTGDWNDSDDFEEVLLTKQPPRGTSFLVRVHGDSMEPTYCDGDRLFIRSQNTLEDGQIGIFCMDGKMFVKELRGNYLISHNADENPPRPLTEDVVCQGRVLGVCTEDYFEE